MSKSETKKQIDLYYVPTSAPCMSVLMFIKTLGLDVNVKEIDIQKQENRTPEYLKMNPQHCAPMINDDGFILWESRAILTYLAEKYAKDDSFYPRDIKKKALVHQRLDFDNGTLHQKYKNFYYPILTYGEGPDPMNVGAFREPVGILDKFLEGQEWVAGENITIADYSIVATISHMEGVAFNIRTYPNVHKWYLKMKQTISSYEEIVPPGIKLTIELYLKSKKKRDY